MLTNSYSYGPGNCFQKSQQFYYVVFDLAGNYVQANDLFKQYFFSRPGVTPPQSFDSALVPEEVPAWHQALQQCHTGTGSPAQATLRMRLAGGLVQSISWEFSCCTGDEGQDPVFHAIGMAVNMTEDTNAKNRLKESETRFRNLVFNLKQGILLQDEQGKLVLVNNAALNLLGVTEEQLTGSGGFHPQWVLLYEDLPGQQPNILPGHLVLKRNAPLREAAIKVFRPATSDWIWLLVNADPVLDDDGKLAYIVCSFTDITEQKRLAKELTEQAIQKQKQITQATIDGQEKERLLIGKELHDNISQHLTTTRLYLEIAKEKISGEMKEMVSFSHKNLVSIIHEIRSLSHSLTPPTLGDIGLVESVQDLSDGVKRMHHISIDFYHRHFDEQHLPHNLKLMLFRVIQEQLDNLARHSKSTAAEITLRSDAEFVSLTITSDEPDPDINACMKNPVLANIENRVSLFNGKVEKHFQEGKGCLLTIHVPVPVRLAVEN